MTWTTHRLRNLKPGERMTYYRGDFGYDTVHGPSDYCSILADVMRVAAHLEDCGRIRLEKFEHHGDYDRRTQNAKKWFEYVAVGCEETV
jgi:hypothetical protein